MKPSRLLSFFSTLITIASVFGVYHWEKIKRLATENISQKEAEI